MYFKTGVFWQSFICSMHITASHRHETNGSINTFGNDDNRRIKKRKMEPKGFCPPSSNSRNSRGSLSFLGWIDTCIFVLVCIWNTKNQEKKPFANAIAISGPFLQECNTKALPIWRFFKGKFYKKTKICEHFCFCLFCMYLLDFCEGATGRLADE